MSSQNNIVMNIATMFEGLKGDSKQKLNGVAKLFAQTFDKFAQPFGINIDKKAIKTIEDLEKKFRELGITATQVGNQISLSMKTADGKFISTSYQYEGGTAGKGSARLIQGATVQSASYLKPTEQLRRNYENVIKARKELDSLEQKGYSKTSDAWQRAEDSLKAYNTQLEETIESLKQRYNLTVDQDPDTKEFIWGNGKGQLETMGRKYQNEMAYAASKKQDTAIIQAEAKARQENTQKVREYVSALKEQWEQENKLATLKKSKAPQDQINQQQKVVKMATDHTNALKNQVKGTKEYAEVEKQLEYAQEKQKQKQLELNQTTQKSTSLFGNFAHTLKQVVSAGLSWKIFSTIINTLKDVQNTVIDLDKSLVDLQIVMGSTREEARTMLSTYSQMAQGLGSTTKEIATQAVEWQRQGYSVEDTNTLIKNSTVLAKVGILEEAEAQEYLTAAMKGFNVSVNQSLGIVDQLTAVDMKAAVSAGGLAEGMSRTANAAQMAGVEMNQLLGYLAVVGETTQKSMSSIGESFKTIFARFGNIKAGKFADDETGESLNDVAKVLSEFNIELYDSQGNMRNVNTILTELSQGWENYTQVQKNAIASAVAGVRQYENFIVLMNNFSKAQDYTTIATESSGTAMEKFGAYTESVEAKINTFKSTFEEFSQNLLNSDLIGKFIDTGTGLLKIADNLKLVQIAFVALIGVGVVKGLTALGAKLNELNNSAQNFVTLNKAMGASFKGFNVSAQQAKANLLALALQTEITGINFANMSKQQVVSTIINANAINAFKGLTKAEIEETLASLGVAEADKAEVAAAIQNILARQGQTISIKALTQAIWLHIKAMLKEIATMAMAHPVITAVVATIAAMGFVIYRTTKRQEELAEAADEASQAFETEKSNLENLNQELETTKNRIKELEAQLSLTFVEQQELSKLKETNSQLALQLNTQKQITKEKQKTAILEQKRKIAGYGYTAQDIIDNVEYVKKTDADDSNSAIKDFFLKFAKDYNSGFAYVKGESLQMLKDYEQQIANYELIPEVDLTPEQRKELQQLKTEYNQLYLALFPEEYKSIKWDEVLGMEEFKGAKKAIQSVVDAGGDNDDVVNMLKNNYEGLIEKLSEFGIEEKDIINQFKKQENVVTELQHELSTLKDTYETLNSTIEEYNSNGLISYDTWEKLLKIEDQYLSALVDENGQIKSNNQALQDLIKTKIEEQTLTRIEAYVTNLEAAAENKTLASYLDLTQGIKDNTAARMANIVATIASMNATEEEKKQALATVAAMAQLTKTISIGSDSTSKAKDATESWEKVLDYANKTLDDQIDKLKEQKEAIEKSIEEQIKAKEKQIELLEAEKKALQDKNEEKNKEIELEELQRNLQKAQQRTMRVYHEGQGKIQPLDNYIG